MISLFLLFLLAVIISILLSKKFITLRQYIPFGMICGILFFVFKVISSVEIPENSGLLFDILLSFSFGSMALESKKINVKAIFQYKDFWFYSIIQFISQWSLAIICGVVISFFIDIPAYLSSLLPVGFAGGYGSAATAGNLYFKGYGIKEAMDIFMFSSTIGLILSILGAIVLVGRTKHKFYQDISHLPSLKQLSIKGLATLSILTLLGIGISYIITKLFNIYIPGFALSFILGNILRSLLSPMIKREDLTLTSYYSSELLVIFGIGLINIKIINQFLAPIFILLMGGLILALLMYFFIAKRILKKSVFERSILTWGWSVGGIITALATIQSLDSKEAKETLKEYMQIYLFIAPFEIAILFISPYFLMAGQWYVLIALLFVFAIIFWHFIYKRDSNSLE